MCAKCNDPNYIVFHRPLWVSMDKWNAIRVKTNKFVRQELAALTYDQQIGVASGGDVA